MSDADGRGECWYQVWYLDWGVAGAGDHVGIVEDHLLADAAGLQALEVCLREAGFGEVPSDAE